MFRGGSFDRSGAGLELHAEWKRRREVEPGPHKGGGPGGADKAQSAKASSMVLMLFLLMHRHAGPLKSPATRSTC